MLHLTAYTISSVSASAAVDCRPPTGRENLTAQQSRWEALSAAMARVLSPAEQESGP